MLVLVGLLLGLVVVVLVGRMSVEMWVGWWVVWCLCLLPRRSWREVSDRRQFRRLEEVDRCWDCRGESKFALCHLGQLSSLLYSSQSIIDPTWIVGAEWENLLVVVVVVVVTVVPGG